MTSNPFPRTSCATRLAGRESVNSGQIQPGCEWRRVARSASAQIAKSNHEAAGVSSSSGGLAGGSEILQKSLSGWSWRTRKGVVKFKDAIRRVGGPNSVSLFTFQYLRCLAVQPNDTRQPTVTVGDRTRAISFRGSRPRNQIRGTGSGAFSSGGQSARLITVRSVVRVHKGPPLSGTASPSWGCSSAGRAPPLQGGGQGFESPHLHKLVPRFIRKHCGSETSTLKDE